MATETGTFAERLAKAVVAELEKTVFSARLEAMVSAQTEETLFKLLDRIEEEKKRRKETVLLTGLRKRQFERFCEYMREHPTEKAHRAAEVVLSELKGRGGYPNATSLQRYASMHRKHW